MPTVKNRRSFLQATVISALLLVLALTSYGVQQGLAQDAKAQATIEKAFPSSSKCKRCHERVFEEWETSPLSRSIHTPTFRAALEPAVSRLRGAASLPGVVVDVRVTTLQLAGDSAEVVVHRRGHYRTDTTRFSSSDTRYRLAWAREGGWSLTQTEPFNFQGEGMPSSRARDVWWPQQK